MKGLYTELELVITRLMVQLNAGQRLRMDNSPRKIITEPRKHIERLPASLVIEGMQIKSKMGSAFCALEGTEGATAEDV